MCGRLTQAKMTTDSLICVSLRCLLGQSVLGIVFHGMDRSITTLNKEKKLCRAKIIIITNFLGMHFYKCRKCIKTIPSSFKNLSPEYLTFRLLGAPPKILFDYHLHFGSLSREHN